MQKRVLFYTLGCLLSFNVLGQYTYEANQDLYDLNANANNFNGELAYEVSDDGISPAIDLSFNFTFYGSCLLYTSPSPRDGLLSRMPSSA